MERTTDVSRAPPAGAIALAPSATVAGEWRSRPISDEAFGRLVGALALVVVVAWAAGLGRTPQGQTFGLIFSSIVIEALPFILLGALVAGAIGVYVPARVFDGIARMPLALQLPGAALSGVAFPVCECGSVPVARRLITRG